MNVWPFRPRKKITESLTWLTDVIRCRAAEQRLSLRQLPRLNWQYSYVLNANQFGRAKLFARAVGTGEFLAPRWVDMAHVGAVSSGVDVVTAKVANTALAAGGQAVIWQSHKDYELVSIDSIVGSQVSFVDPLAFNYSAAFIIPVEVARFRGGLSGTRSVGNHTTTKATMLVNDVAAPGVALNYPSYQNHPVLIDRSLVLRSVRERFERESTRFDNAVGVVLDDDSYTYPVQQTVAKWELQTRAEAQALRQWLHTARGKWKGFWVPSWNPDVVLAGDISSTDSDIAVEPLGLLDASVVSITVPDNNNIAVDLSGQNQGYVTLTSLPLPAEGVLYLADGVTPVAVHTPMPHGDVTNLVFTPASGFVGNVGLAITRSDDTPFDLMIADQAGNYQVASVAHRAAAGAEEMLVLSAAAGFDLTMAEVDKACRVTFMRFDSDRSDLRHDGQNISLAMPVMECPVP